MIAILTLLIVLAVSMLVTRVGGVSLMLTGLSQDLARFQARSAFTGVGFTTRESEQVVNHPVRRRIVMLLMLLGNAGIVAVVSSFIVSFINLQASVAQGPLAVLMRLGLLLLGIALLCLLAWSPVFNRWLTRVIGLALKRWTSLEVRDYASLLHLSDNYRVTEFQVEPNDWLANRRLDQLELTKEGFLVLGIQRADGAFLGTPVGHSEIRPNDLLIVYGREDALVELDQRRRGASGDAAHKRAVAEQEKMEKEEERKNIASADAKEEGSP